MNKQQFLDELEKQLAKIPDTDRKEILLDQQEFIREAILAGRDETEVIAKLGSPKDFAASLLADYKFQKIKTAEGFIPTVKAFVGSLGAFLILAPFNFIVLIGPLMALFVVLVVAFSLEITALAMGLTGLGYSITSMVGLGHSWSFMLTVVFGSLGLLGVGAMITYICGYILLFSYRQMLSYLAWNLNFIKKNRIQF
jgi:uncharacterized membrane protein